MANLFVTNRPMLVMRCWPSSTSNLSVRDLVEVDQPERISLEQRVNDRLLALPAALGVDVVPLILGLNRELPAQPEQAFAFELVVDEPVADVGDGEVGAEDGFHFLLPFGRAAVADEDSLVRSTILAVP